MRTPSTKKAARLHILQGVQHDGYEHRWIVEALIELCLTLDDSGHLISSTISRVGDQLDSIEKRLHNVEKAIDET